MIDEGTTAKLIGIFGGTVLALVFAPPRSMKGLARRIIAAVVFGWLFGPTVREYIGWDDSVEHLASSFAIAAYAAWWSLGAFTRIAERTLDKNFDDA